MNAPLSTTGQSAFTSAVPVLPTTDMAQAITFYEQLGFSVLHQQADYALLKRDAAELHVWLCTQRSLCENSSCRIMVRGIEALSQELQAKGLLDRSATVTQKPWGTKELVVFSPERVLITFVEQATP
jgi:catechol 2,3-dioxygenase-like lactoylglutathione lyase family enzyme